MWPFDEKKKQRKNGISFGAVLTGLQDAVGQVQEMLQNRQLQNLANFWEADGKPVSQAVQVGNEIVDVPLLTLVPHSQLAMDSVKVDFSIRVNEVVPESSDDLLKGCRAEKANGPVVLSHAGLQMAMDGVKKDGEDVMQVSITFKVKETPEAVSRLMDEYNKHL